MDTFSGAPKYSFNHSSSDRQLNLRCSLPTTIQEGHAAGSYDPIKQNIYISYKEDGRMGHYSPDDLVNADILDF